MATRLDSTIRPQPDVPKTPEAGRLFPEPETRIEVASETTGRIARKRLAKALEQASCPGLLDCLRRPESPLSSYVFPGPTATFAYIRNGKVAFEATTTSDPQRMQRNLASAGVKGGKWRPVVRPATLPHTPARRTLPEERAPAREEVAAEPTTKPSERDPETAFFDLPPFTEKPVPSYLQQGWEYLYGWVVGPQTLIEESSANEPEGVPVEPT
ncbi:MAG: hypothetical protein OXF02_06040 [Simkaniaceae bacterium]|nr:hypothetical protein [Simkaniaceae bacterium]